tara:strand:- start:71 stop:334 length:264 start_codon:yes stop_codon:yes gene_type:complete
MNKFFNLIFLIIFMVFFFNIIKFYTSSINIKNINLNRGNIDEMINDKIFNLPKLKSDTNKVIEFNDSFSDEIKNEKPHNFWDLLRSK